MTGGGAANALVVLDAEGNMTVLHPESTLTVTPGENLAAWGATFLQSLQEQGSAAVAPVEGTDGTEQTEGTEEQPVGEQTPRLVKTWTTKNGRKVELFVMPEEIDEQGNRHVKIGRRVDGGEIEATSVNGIDIPEDIIDYETTFADVDLALENENNFKATEVIYLSDGRILARGTINGDKSSFWLKSDPLKESQQEEQSSEQAPSGEQPAGEQPAEGTPVGEQPVEGAPAEGAPAEGEGEQPTIPTNEHGRKLYHQGVDLDVAIDDILSEEAPDNDVNALADRRIKTAQRKLDDLNKDNKKLAKQFEDKDFDDDEYDDVRAAQRGEELPYGTKLGEYAQQRMEQEAIIKYYNQLKSRYAARRAMEILAGESAAGGTSGNAGTGSTGGATGVGETGGGATGGEENVPDWTVDKASDARARGYRMENGHRIDRNGPVSGEEGSEVEVKFDKAEEPVKGKWVVLDTLDGFLVPSHVNGQRNVRYFITEAQPKERTDADSENSSTAIAEHVNPEEITNGVTAYTGAPVVNIRGEVIQGNNRTIGLQKMWGNDAYAESQKKYKQYLIDHAEEFGLDAAAIEDMDNPVLVRMIDVSDEEAIRLGQKTAANTESGGVERIDANRVLNQMGDKFDTFIRLLFAGAEDEDMTLMGLIVKNGVQVLKWLNDGRNHAKFITDTEYQSCFDKKSNLTEEAKQDLQKIVEGMLFADAPDNLRDMFYRMPAKAQNAILATFFRDAQSPKEASIIKDIQNAIEAFETISNASPEFKAAKVVNDARVAVKDVQKQTSMFGNTGTILEKFDNFALELAILFKGAKQNTIRDYFNAYYDAVQGKGGDMFNEAVAKTKPEAIKEIFGIETNNQENNGQEGNGSLESGSDDGAGGQPGNAGESGNGEPPAEGGGPAVGGGGTAGTGEVSEREQYIAEHPLTEEEIDASDAPKMRKNLAKGYLNGSNDSQLAKAAYTSIYNKKKEGENAGESVNFNIDEIKELDDAPRSVRKTIAEDALSAYNSANLKVPAFQFGVPEEEQERMTYEKFHDEFMDKVGTALGRPCEPYLRAVYDYIDKKLEEARAARRARQGQAPQGEAPQGEASQGEAPQGEAPQGEAPRGEQPAGEAPAASDEGLSEATKAARDRVQAILDRMKKNGKKPQNGNNDGVNAYSIAGLTDAQIDDMLELVEAGAELGYTLLDGVQTKDEWLSQMRGLIGESVKDATGYNDAELDELLEDLWNAPYENEWGDTNTIAEYAAEKGITTTNNNDNGTEETGESSDNTGNGGGNTVGSGAEGEVGTEDTNDGRDSGTSGETSNGSDTSGGNRGGNGGRGSSGTRSSGESGTSATGTGGRSGGRKTNGGANGGNGTNDGGRTQPSGEQPAAPGGTSSVGQPERVEPKKPLADVSQEKAPYVPASIGGKYAIGSVVPSGVADAIAQAFKRLREQHKKEVLDFVRDELGYSSNEEMLSDFDSGKTDGLAAEQVDAVALAISAMKNGKSFIVGDMTGVGKGRTAAALIRWGKKQGKKVLFITERSSLFSDMYRDLTDIGCDYMPFVTNSDPDANITDSDGNKVIPKPNAAAQSALWQREDDELPRDKKGRQYDFVMTTYSQASNPRGANAKNKLEWLSNYAKDAIVIMDESHNASGESNRGEYFKDIVRGAEGATFLSATYAKRPDNMLLYALRSSMSETHMSTGDMLQAIKDYGVPMQELMAAALYGSGEMIRRERDMSDVKTTWTDPKVIYSEEEYEQCRKTSDKTMDLVNDIIDFQRDFIDPIVKRHEEQFEQANKMAALTGGPMTHAGNTPYSSQVSNVVGLMVYAMKAKKAAQMAIEQIKQGKKPVIAVENTLESYVKELDDDVREAGFGPIFEKGVRFSLKYSIAQYVKKEGKYEKDKDSEVIYDAEAELDDDGQRALERLRQRVQEYVADKDKIDLTLSPIDLIKQMIADAGYNCGEITGRSYQLERKADGNGFWKTPFKAKKKDVARKFNGGSVEKPLSEKDQYQALILNVAGATGISLHSSKKFGNQQPRTMIILQPARDVNIEVQMRGRIDRTGQVHRGEYFYVTSPIPAEQKMTMMLRQKLASLDAQSVGTKDVSSNKVESQDMDNKYGDEVCKNFLLEHLNDINAYLDNGLRYNNKTREWEGRPGLLYDVLKNLQRMSCEMQEMVINELTQRYQDQIDYLNQNGINDLETTTMNLEAVTIDKATFVKGKDNESINEFAHDTTIERVEVNVLKKPMRSSDIKKKMKELDTLDEDGLPKEGISGQTNDKVSQVVNQKYTERATKFAEQEAKLEQKIRTDHPRKEGQSEEEWEKMVQSWPTLQEMVMKHQSDLAQYGADLSKQQNMVYKASMYLKPGRPYLVPLTDDVGNDSVMMYGRFLGFQMKNGDPRNIQAVFAVKDSRAMISIPIVNQQKVIEKILAERGDTEITALERDRWGDDLSMEEKAKKWDEWWDKMIPKNTSRQIRYMITGNVLQACGSLGKYKGQIVTFTRKNKDTGEITLERGMLLAENFDPENFRVRRAVVKKDIWSHYDEVKDEKSNISCSRQGDTLIVKFEKRKGEKLTDHPANKDATLKALAMNGEIRPSGKTAIMCVVKEANVEKALEHLYKEYGYTKEELFVMPDSTEKPDAIVRSNRPYQDVIDEFSPKYGSEYWLDGKIKQMLKRYRMDVNNEGLKQDIREAVQLRQAYLRKRFTKHESNLLAWQVLVEDENIERFKDDKDSRENHMRIKEAILEELEFRGFKGTALHLEQGQMTFDDVKNLFNQLNDPSTEEGKAKKLLFDKVMAKVTKLPMDIALDETIQNSTGGFAGGRVIRYNWKYMNADYIADQAKADTILHELIHTVTSYACYCVELGYEHLIDKEMLDAVNELQNIYNLIRDDDTFTHNGVEAYGVKDLHEMLAEAGSNSQFRDDLKKTGLWAKMKSGFLAFFGIKQNVQNANKTNAYDEIMIRLDNLIESFNEEAWNEIYKGSRYGGYQRINEQRLDAQQRTQKRNAAQRRSAEAFSRRQFERAKMRAKEWSDKLKIGDIMDVYESIDDVPGSDKFLPRKRAARGWFDPDTGRITIVIGNHRNPNDVVTTILHEAVAHHGLRKLFGENFDNFLDNVYKSSEAQIRAAINELRPKYNGDVRRATEEYLATLAENTDFERAGTTSAIAHWFNNVKEQFLQMLAKIGLRDYRGVEFSNNELRYILWRSYKNMEEPGRYRNRFNIPEVTSMEEKLGVGNGARIVRMGFIEDEVPAGVVTQNDVRKIRDRLSKMSLREAQAAYDRINAQMLDENGLNIDEHTDKVRLDWLAQHGREGVGKAMSDDLEALQNKYGSAMIVLRWELQDRINELQKSNVREEPLFRDGIEDDVEQNGLRGAVGDESYRKYMRDLWTSKGNQEMHQWVTEHLAENGFNLYDTIDKYLKQAAENGEGSQEMWENVRDGLKEATGKKRMSLREARWLSWLSGRKGDRSNPDDSMKKNAVRWRIGRRRDMARLTEDKHSYAGIGPDVDMTDEMSIGNTPSTNLAKMWYHRQLDNWATQWTEAYVDYAVSLKKLVLALTGARDINQLADDENAYTAENHMSSVITQREFQFMRDHWTPLQNAVDACLPDLDTDVEKAMSALEDYMRAKHGLERNREFFVRDWILAAEKAQQKGLKNAPTVDLEQLRENWDLEKSAAWGGMLSGRLTYRQYLETLDDFIRREMDADWDSSLLKNDRSGIRNYAHQTDDAFEEDDVISDVEDMERVLGDKADALWDAINDVTDYSLDSDYESGLISKENREHVGKMFHFYVPLRGFNEKVANEVYDYMGIPISNPVGLATLMKAKGRKSLSDSPLAVMGAMSTSAISRGERNKVKQKLLRLVRNNYNAKDKDRLVSLSKIWLENIGTEDNPIWEERWPEFDENDSADEIARKVEDFNTDMEQKLANGMAMPRRANLRIPYRAKEAEKRQHMVEVKENGESYLIIINGDPRAAQAMNGLLTPDNADKNHTLGLLKKVISPVNRFLSSAFTTWNPTFVLRNTLRDAIMSRSVVLTKEGEGYLMRFRANWYKLLWPELLNGRLWKKYRSGTLDESNFLERCFKEFMEGGGETGYVEQKNVDKWRKMLLDGSREYARKHGGFRRRAAYSASQVTKAAIGLIEDYNERAENLARFATYLTSREMGRSQLRSVADAKDVSVNFNRKGAGGSSADKNLLAGVTAELFKSLYLFFNAGMQSLALMARNIKKHPVRFMRAQFANHFVMGITIVMLNKWLVSVLGDDDTAENPYANLPEWTRRNNLCFFVGGNDWVTIPLPIELRAFYGLGDIAAGYFVDPQLKSLKNPAEDFVAQLSQILPVDFMGEGGDVLSAFVPDAVKPLTQIKNNKDWTGKPIQKKETEWNKYDPEWTKAFRSTDKNVVGAARWLSNVTGGDNVKPGKIDISPAYALHILKGYTGGLGQTVTEAGGIIRDVAKWDFEDFNMRNVPLAKAVYNQSDDRTAYYRTRAKFYKYVEDTKKSKHYISGYKKSAEDPMYRAALIRMMQKDALKNQIIDNAQKDLKKLQKAANEAKTGAERKQFEQYQYRVQEQAVKVIEGME